MAGRAQPSLKTALDIYDKTGAKLGLLEGLDAPTIEKLRPKAAA
jgi:hypothetical protein